jgi:hypothetical protein
VSAGGGAPQTTSTRSTSWRGECAGYRYQTRDGEELLSGSPWAPGSATLGRPGGPIPDRVVAPALEQAEGVGGPVAHRGTAAEQPGFAQLHRRHRIGVERGEADGQRERWVIERAGGEARDHGGGRSDREHAHARLRYLLRQLTDE